MLSPGLTFRRVVAIDLREDIAVAEVELGLIEIAPGDLKLGFGLLDIGSAGRQPSEGAIDVAFLLERLDHVTGALVERMDDAETEPHSGSAPPAPEAQTKRSDRDRAAPGRDLPRPGRRRQSQRGAELMDIGQRRGNVRAGS